MSKPSNSKMLRINNKSDILWKLYNNGAMSRVALAKKSGLTGAAVTIIVKNMLEEGYLIENGKRLQRNNQGRKEVLLDINYENFLACNINIEKDKIHISLCSLKSIIREEILVVSTPDGLIDNIIYAIKKVISGYEKCVLGIGAGVIGTVDEEKGIIINSYGLFQNNYNLKAVLYQNFNMPVYISNNVRAHAKAIIDDNNKNFLYIKHGPGLGSAIVNNGNIITGFNNMAGELGHTVVDSNSFKSLEENISENQLFNLYKNKINNINELYELYGEDKSITDTLDDCINKLVISIVNTVTIIDPEKIIVSGGLFDNEKTYTAFQEKYDLAGYKYIYKIQKLPKTINIKGIANSRLVFNKEFFNF